MYFLADTANPQELKKAFEYFPLKGITTNPTIISREKKKLSSLVPVLKKILKGKMIHIQLLSSGAADMVREAELYKEKFDLENNYFAKLPITAEGLKAIPKITAAGTGVTATAVYTPLQAELAAQAGADFVVPYFNRLDNLSIDGAEVIAQMAEIFEMSQEHDCQILAASFKNVNQVNQAALAGAHAATVPPDLLKSLIDHPMVDKAVKDFTKDGAKYY